MNILSRMFDVAEYPAPEPVNSSSGGFLWAIIPIAVGVVLLVLAVVLLIRQASKDKKAPPPAQMPQSRPAAPQSVPGAGVQPQAGMAPQQGFGAPNITTVAGNAAAPGMDAQAQAAAAADEMKDTAADMPGVASATADAGLGTGTTEAQHAQPPKENIKAQDVQKVEIDSPGAGEVCNLDDSAPQTMAEDVAQLGTPQPAAPPTQAENGQWETDRGAL